MLTSLLRHETRSQAGRVDDEERGDRSGGKACGAAGAAKAGSANNQACRRARTRVSICRRAPGRQGQALTAALRFADCH